MRKKYIPWILHSLLLYMSAFSQGTLDKIGSRSFFGRLVDISEVPFIVLVIPGSQATCTGFIVAQNWVITAAHCFDETEKDAIVVIGTNDRHKWSKRIEAESVILHPNFLVKRDEYDIALIKLKHEIKITKNSQIIKIENKEWPGNVLRRLCYTAGYGRHITTGQSGILHGGQVSVGIGPYPYDCSDLADKADNLIWTNKNESEPICFGDYGSPLVCDHEAVGVGVISFSCGSPKPKYGVSCGDSYVDGYVSLHRNLDWLKSQIGCLPSSCNNGISFLTANRNLNFLIIILLVLLAKKEFM